MKAAEYLDFPIGEKWPKRRARADHRSEAAALCLISSLFSRPAPAAVLVASSAPASFGSLCHRRARQKESEKDGFGSIFLWSRPPDRQILVHDAVSPPQPMATTKYFSIIKERRPTRAEGCFYFRVPH